MVSPSGKAATTEGDWIDDFLEYTANIPSPRIFKLWAGITCLAASLERRVWVVSAQSEVYATMYVLLVGRPGSGKSQAIRPVTKLWYDSKEMKVASNSVTKASLTDELDEAKRIFLNEGGDPPIVEYHSLQIAASEFGVLVPAHDLDFLNFLNQIYDNDPNYRESRRSYNRKIDTINPQINILAGTQPAYLATLLPEEAWGMGFMTRILMVHSGETFRPRLFDHAPLNKGLYLSLLDRVKSNLKLFGKAEWDEDAKTAIQQWADEGCPPEPEHSRLANYSARRILHVIRLCLVAATSAGHPFRISLFDFERARGWLLDAESTMPDVFKDMNQRSDAQIIQELHMFIWQAWVKEKKPIHEARVYFFLQAKLPSFQIQKVLETAVRANILDRVVQPDGSNHYRPRPRNEHGVE